jgi:hypothetical protein
MLKKNHELYLPWTKINKNRISSTTVIWQFLFTFEENTSILLGSTEPTTPKPYGKEKFLRKQFKLCLSMKVWIQLTKTKGDSSPNGSSNSHYLFATHIARSSQHQMSGKRCGTLKRFTSLALFAYECSVYQSWQQKICFAIMGFLTNKKLNV